MARVLIVEDDRDLRELLAEVLTEAGHDVLKAHDGAHGLQVLLDKAPRLLLTDIAMPQMNGLELLQVVQEMRSVRFGLKIIAISGAPERLKALETAATMGANKILAKPFTPTELIKMVDQVLADN